MTPKTTSAGSIHEIMMIPHALRAEGMTDEEAQGLAEIPEMASVMVQAGRMFLQNHMRQNTGLDTPIERLNLAKGHSMFHHIEGVLHYFGIRVVGDLAQLRELDLTEQAYIGKLSVQAIKDGAAQFGVELFGPSGTPLQQAIAIAGNPRSVQARLMRLWQSGIDSGTQHYLRNLTLGDLIQMSRDAFVANRRLAHYQLLSRPTGPEDGPQAEVVANGLATAGLRFKGE